MYSYIAYGLRITSGIFLPELLSNNSGEGRVDVTIGFGFLNPPPLQATSSECYCHISKQEAYLYWKDGGTFLVRNGCEIVIEAIPNVSEQVLRIYLLGAALGLLLHQRGLMTLHASTVMVNGEAIAFVGDRGWGKSTTIGAMMNRGHLTLSDDVTAIDLNQPFSPLVLSGFPQIKLWCDSAISLGHQLESLPRLHPDFEKRVQRFNRGFVSTVVPLKCIYILSLGANIEIESMSSSVALATTLRNWYCARFGEQMLQIMGIKPHFQKCSELVNRVKVYMLKRPNDLSRLDELARSVEEHFIKQIQSSTTASSEQ
ncbi:hypothetical protein [Myxosarcina sp. GI1]|uniref:hypothetical protein n=1 Tax=Myxosarcina sp. GI1 TaxID=1541065 RepID=UPI00068B8892|nr:hypothetical protein [Myxosarcina sp. GI1]